MNAALTQIEKDMALLKESMDTLHDVVLDQQPAISSIEDMIIQSKQEVQKGEQEIVEAQTEQSSYYYLVAGAVTSIGAAITLLILL
jgi:t-SNARE complex subunit (syntaxin)